MTTGQQLKEAKERICNLEKMVAELKDVIVRKDERIESLESSLAWLRKRVFGRMSEKKHLPTDPNALQLSLFPELLTDEERNAISEEAEKMECAARKAVEPKAKPARRPLDTSTLPVEKIDIYPEGTTDGDGQLLAEYTEIGVEVTRRLERIPARLYIVETVRHKVVHVEDRQADNVPVMIAPLPPAPIDKCIAGASVLADILVDKFVYHLPFYRIINKYKEGGSGISIPSSTMNGWYEATIDKLRPLYELLRKKVMASGYIQVDESIAPVLDSEKHRRKQGYFWVVRDAIGRQLYFIYDMRGRQHAVASTILSGYKGILQTDGYQAYEQFEKDPDITLVACWAHARRKFVDALETDKKRASEALALIAQLYKVESEADLANLDDNQRKAKRQSEAYPVILMFEKWLADNYPYVLAKSPIGKAISYAYALIERLSRYVNDGRILPDNNMIENAIRPLALGRKNWLFCSNDASAVRTAIIYSLIGSCKAADVDPRRWLEDVLCRLPLYRRDQMPLDDLLPVAWKSAQKQS